MAKKGNEIDLTSGVMFSPQRVLAENNKDRLELFRAILIEHTRRLGYEVSIKKRPSQVIEAHFLKGGKEFSIRSVFENDIHKIGARTSAGRLIQSAIADIGEEFSWEDLPEKADPELRPFVDSVGSPDTPQRRDMSMPFASDWTIARLKEWAEDNEMPVPGNITRKGDILEWMVNEYSNRGG